MSDARRPTAIVRLTQFFQSYLQLVHEVLAGLRGRSLLAVGTNRYRGPEQLICDSPTCEGVGQRLYDANHTHTIVEQALAQFSGTFD